MNWGVLRSTWLGGILLAGDIALFFSAIKLVSIVDVTVIGAFQPAFVLIAARRLFGERLGRWDLLWILLAMSGVTITVIGPGVTSHHQLVGDLFAVGAMLCWSGYWLVSKHARVASNALEYTTGIMIVAAVIMTPIVLLSGQSVGRVETGDWLWIFMLVIVPGIGHLLMNWAHGYVDASVSSVIGCLSSLVAALAAWLILGQTLSTIQVGGLLVGLTSIAVVAARHRETVGSDPETRAR
jgi:drug/metabolite transporter (DMT)-like permease